MQRTKAHLALFAVNLIYGANYPISKALMPEVIGPSGFILLRAIGGVVLFWIFWSFRREQVHVSDLPRLALCGLFGVAVNQLLFYQGLARTSPLHASIIMVATPIIVLVLSHILIGERVTWRRALGVGLGLLGALGLVMMGAQGADEGATLLGDVFILVNATSFAIFLVVVKPLMARYSAITVMSWAFLFGGVVVTPFGLDEFEHVAWGQLGSGVVASMCFVVIGVTFLAYLLNTWAMRVVQPGVVGTYIYLQPVMAIAAAWTYLAIGFAPPGHLLQPPVVRWPHIVCAAAIFLGVHLAGRAERR
ncbi:MAG: DMT family transporter [Flavobacteriales bacterium]|nr:DMT family transporter [Flavobacteriales bacterium]MCB9167291.1 DMT family transporter [Flavobacteriales bacterium]